LVSDKQIVLKTANKYKEQSSKFQALNNVMS